MTAQLQEQLSRHLPSTAAMQADAKQVAADADKELSALKKKLGSAEAAIAHQRKMLAEVAKILKAVAAVPSHASEPGRMVDHIDSYCFRAAGLLKYPSKDLKQELLKLYTPTSEA
jgi:hypothetical protein